MTCTRTWCDRQRIPRQNLALGRVGKIMVFGAASRFLIRWVHPMAGHPIAMGFGSFFLGGFAIATSSAICEPDMSSAICEPDMRRASDRPKPRLETPEPREAGVQNVSAKLRD